MKRSLIILLTILTSLIAGCAEIPKSQLDAYVKVFSEAKQASEQVMLDLSVSSKLIKDFEKKNNGDQASPSSRFGTASEPYVPPVRVKALARVNGISARLAVFEVIDQYNTVLVTLASGESVQKIKDSTSQLVESASLLIDVAGSSVPGLSQAAGLIKVAAAAAEKYRARAEFSNLIRDGRPHVSKILHFLIDDTPTIVNVHEGIWTAEIAPLRLKASNSVREIIMLAKNRQAPTTDADKKSVNAIETRVNQLSGQNFKIRWSAQTGDKVADRALISKMRIKLSEAEGHYLELAKASEKSPSLRAVMNRYNNLLLATDEAMENIEKVLEKKPVDVSKMILELLETAMALKQEYAAFRANF